MATEAQSAVGGGVATIRNVIFSAFTVPDRVTPGT